MRNRYNLKSCIGNLGYIEFLVATAFNKLGTKLLTHLDDHLNLAFFKLSCGLWSGERDSAVQTESRKYDFHIVVRI